MRPPKHSPLFMAIALALAIMLFISYPIPVYAIPVAPIIAILCSTIGGFILGWFLNDMTQHEARSPGVTLDTYVLEIAVAYDSDVGTLSNYGYNVLAALERMRLYYARLAEHRVLDYLDKSPEYLDMYEAEIMIDVARDLCNLTNAYFTSLNNALDYLNYLSYNRFTGDLKDYSVYISMFPDTLDYSYDLDNIADLWVFYEPQEEVKLFDCQSLTLANASSGSTLSAARYLVLAGEVKAGIALKHGTTGEVITNTNYRYLVFVHKHDGNKEILHVIDLGENLKRWHILGIINYIDSIYDTAWAYAKARHYMWRARGYTDKSQIPPGEIDIPPDVVMPVPWNLQQNKSMTYEEVLAYILAYLKSAEKFFNESYYKMVKYLDHLNLTMPDVREWLKNVVIRLPNGTIWLNVTKLIPIWYPGVQTFYPGQDNVLQNPMGALAQLPNGEWIYLEIPSGYMINPALVHTPHGETTNPWTLQPYQGGFNPIYENYQSPEPEYVKTMHEVMQLIMALMPLLILLAIIQMIPRIVSGRR